MVFQNVVTVQVAVTLVSGFDTMTMTGFAVMMQKKGSAAQEVGQAAMWSGVGICMIMLFVSQ